MSRLGLGSRSWCTCLIWGACAWSCLEVDMFSFFPKAQDFVALETEALQGVEEVKTSWSADGVAERCPLAAWCYSA